MTVATPSRGRVGLGGDFRRLWAAYALSGFGSAVGYGALPLVALLVLDASDFQVSLLAALSGFASAALALRLVRAVEFRRKRPTMIAADLIRCAALVSVPVAAAAGVVSYVQLCVVGVVAATGEIAFRAASTAHLKGLVAEPDRIAATSRLESTFWLSLSAGPPLGGALITWVGATVTLVIDAVTYLLSALGIRSMRTPEPAPPTPDADGGWFTDALVGWRTIVAHRGLRALWWNSMLFGGCILLSSPLITVLMIRDLGLEPWAFGIAMGAAPLGGVLGAMLAPRLVARLSERRVLLTFGVLRACWLGFVALAPVGLAGFVVITVAETMLLICAGVFNPTFAAYRMRVTPDDRMARVMTAWSISGKVVQPVFILAGGLIAAVTSTRTALGVAAGVLLCSGLLLPWRDRDQPG